jgi:magnesium transporter
MIKMYQTDIETNMMREINTFERGCWINMTSPSEAEIKRVCEYANIQEDFIRYSLDSEEKARIDYEEDDDTILFILDVPTREKERDREIYTTMPIGIIVVRDECIITVSLKKLSLIEDFALGKMKGFATYKKSRFILQIMFKVSSSYLTTLKLINDETEMTEYTLKKSMQNQELLKLLDIEKSLVYITTSLRANEAVMERTVKIKSIKLYADDEDILEDAIIENKQAIEMSKIYTDVLNSSMDAYSSVISNNLNETMKLLTSITIIISIPTLIASLWGMNVEVPFEISKYGFWILCAIAIIITAVTVILLNKKGLLRR